MEPGGDPCGLKCTLILTSDIVKGWYGHFNRLRADDHETKYFLIILS